MNPRRRTWLLALSALTGGLAQARPGDDDSVRRGSTLDFPRDHGAHPGRRIEWWYATGWLAPRGAQSLVGFQITFFRSRTGLAADNPSRFAARQLLFAHAALTDVTGRRHVHADRLARWSGAEDAALRARASTRDMDLHLDGWRFVRQPAADGSYEVAASDAGLGLDLRLVPTQPLLLQGDAGWSQKGPQEAQASHYVSHPQLAASGRVEIDGKALEGVGRAWLDHEWSDEVLHPQAVGWDWIGINLDDGGALTVFRLRRADGSALWAGGSFRPAGGAVRPFQPGEVRLDPGRRWRSPASNGDYPVEWTVATPAGRFGVRALLDGQELDGRASTGTVYWEGLSELLDGQGGRVGLGYLEMTGYAGRLRL
jgi:predicted secreted hydrolase